MLVFGINKVGSLLKNIEQESFPVFVILPRPETQVKMSYRMNFNASSMRLMLGHKWTIGQDINEETGLTRNFFVNLSNIPAGVVPNISFEVCNNGNVNNQKLWKYLREILNNENDLIKFKLSATVIDEIEVLLFEEYNTTVNVEHDVLSKDLVEHEEFLIPPVVTEVIPMEEVPSVPEIELPVWGIEPTN